MVNPGDRIKIENGYVSEWQGEMQLTSGRLGKIEVIGKAEPSEPVAEPAEPSAEEATESSDDDESSVDKGVEEETVED